MAGPGPTCGWEQDHTVLDGTSCVAESRLPGSLRTRSPWAWERGEAVYAAYSRALVLAPAAIYEQTGYALGKVLEGLIPGLLEMMVVVGVSAALGAVAGGVVGFFFGGAGAAPGAVIGAELGFDAAIAVLTWMGVAFLISAMVQGFSRLWSQLSLGVHHAWEAPEYPEREYPHKIEQAAREIADAAGILMLLLLQAVVAYVLKRAAMGSTQSVARTVGAVKTAGSEATADAAVSEVVGKLRGSKLGGEFAKWVEDNWPKLKEDPRLRFRPKGSGTVVQEPPPEVRSKPPEEKPKPADPFKYYMDQAEKLDVTTPKNSAVFYSGRQGLNRKLAEQFASQNGKMTLESTPGGKWLDGEGLFGPDSPLTPDQATQVWARLSQRYAESASGDVVGFVEGANPGGIFNTVEYPALVKNPNVTNVITMGH